MCLVLYIQLLGFILALKPPKSVEGNWKKVFSTNFKDKKADLSKWDFITGPPPDADLIPSRFSRFAPGLSYYVPKNAKQTKAGLELTAREERYNDNGKRYDYTGANARLNCDLRYGFINIKAKLPKVSVGGRYYMGLTSKNKGKITIMEAINDASFYSHDTKVEEKLSDFEWLFTNTNGFTGSDYFDYKPGKFNDFSVHWGYQNVTFYINGKLASFQTLKLGNLNTIFSLKKHRPYPVDEILNLEISNGVGNWGGYPSWDTQFPFTMVVDKVEIYQDQRFDRNHYKCSVSNRNLENKEETPNKNDKIEKNLRFLEETDNNIK